MHEEPSKPLPESTSHICAGGRSPDSVDLLKGLDRILAQRADAIEAEFREITQVRERIRKRLLAAGNDASGLPEILGQLWGK